ncbi:porin [Alcaligenes faecalis]|uniref:porin n=1 Tax=Alcaligenes faecalis TaxID=511 RepID=UPI002933EA73|nr:porin [Alcaligenes faecalis]MDV2116568.1 porin [Alcaligenes faecalis]
MKKTILAALLMPVLAAPAYAASNVTLYGVVDTGLGYERWKGSDLNGGEVKQSRFGLYDQGWMGNRWGLKGSEDLGGGLKANFVLESGFDLSTGNMRQGRLFGRQATIGLSGDSWGRVDLGRQTTVTSLYVAGVASPFGGNGYQYGVGAAFNAANTVRYDNMLAYQSPEFSGFQFGAGYSFNTNGTQKWDRSGLTGNAINSDEANVKAFSVAMRYSDGPLKAALSFDQARYGSAREQGGNLVAADSGTVSAWSLAASYQFSFATVHAAFGQSRNGYIGGSLQTEQFGPGLHKDLKVNSYALGVTVPTGKAGSVLASWTMADPRSTPRSTDDAKTQHVFSAGYLYNLSKRTNLYAIGSYARNIGYYNDLKSTVATVGMTHRF